MITFSHTSLVSLLVMILCAPLITAAQTTGSPSDPYQFKSDGIFSCDATAADLTSLSSSIGHLSGVANGQTSASGQYVPVFDQAVAFNTDATVKNTNSIVNNTGIIVYKECILRVIVVKMRQAATAGYQQLAIKKFNTMRNGNPNFPVILSQDQVQRTDESRGLMLKNGTYDPLGDDKNLIVRTILRGYYNQTRQPNQVFACPQTDSQASIWDKLSALQNPACSLYWKYELANEYSQQQDNYSLYEMMTRLGFNNGIYDNETIDANGNHVVQTPGSIVGYQINQLLGSGYRQLESANDIGQMVGALLAGISTQIISDGRGLTGLTQPIGNGPSYLDRMVKESSQGLINSAANAALKILAGARAVETAYHAVMDAIAANLTGSIGQLRSVENQCWGLIISKVCASPPTGTTCTDASGNTLRIATSTQFSQPIIIAQIAPLASTTVSNIQKSDTALSLIDQLIAGVSNTASVDAQRIALQQLDTLIANKQLHVQTDVDAAQQQANNIKTALTTLVSNTTQTWGDDPDPTKGWCNINNPAVITMWHDRWK